MSRQTHSIEGSTNGQPVPSSRVAATRSTTRPPGLAFRHTAAFAFSTHPAEAHFVRQTRRPEKSGRFWKRNERLAPQAPGKYNRARCYLTDSRCDI